MFANLAILAHLHTLSPAVAWLVLTLFLYVMFESGLMEHWCPAVLIGLATLWDALAIYIVGVAGLHLLQWVW